jgi:hypothetical protein
MKFTPSLLLMSALAASLALKAQTTPSAFEFRALIRPGTTIAGHKFTDDTVFGTVALADNGDFAFIAHWKDYAEHEAIFTSKTIVARRGDTIDGKHIEAIPLDGKLAINSLGQVAYTAVYSDFPSDLNFRGVASGLFLDSHFVLAPLLNPVNFDLADDGQLINEQTSPDHFRPMTCTLPIFPIPVVWSNALGSRINSYRYDPPLKGRTYIAELPFLSQYIEAPYRLVYFGPDCLPLMIVLGDFDNGVIAVYTQTGLLSGIDPEGYLDFFQEESFTGLLPEPFTHKNPPLAMNRGGQVLFSVNYGGKGLHLLTPKTAGAK